MTGRPPFHRLAAALFLLCGPALAAAAPVAPDQNAGGRAQVVKPAVLQKLNDLDFGAVFVPNASGTLTINPNTEALTTTGAVIFAGGSPHSARFEAVSPTKTVVIIRAPRQPATLTRVGGTETMRVDNWTISGQARRTVAAQEPFSFNIGGTLYVGANQAEGTYTGTFDVEIQYP